MGLEKLLTFFDISKDTVHFNENLYAKKLRGNAGDIKEATFYMANAIVPKLPLHFIRGAVVGGALGLLMSQFGKHQEAYYALFLGTLDWTQFGARVLRKVYRAHTKHEYD